MSDFLLEIIRAIVVLIIFFYLWWVGSKENIRKQAGWIFIMSGFGLVLFGMLIDITDEFPSLDKYVVIGDTEIQAFLEKVVGYLVGFLLLSIGFWKWMPTVVSLNKTKLELQKSHEQLEEKVRERTLDLQKSKERLTVTLRSIGDGVIGTDNEGKVTLMNMMAEKLTGWSQADALGRPLHEVFPVINKETHQRCESLVDKVLQSGMIVGLANHTVLVRRDGRQLDLADNGAPIRNQEGKVEGVVLVFRDVTEALKMKDEILKARKLESVGVLAGGIAHDFNNILAAILGNISLAAHILNPDHEVYELLSEVEKASLRAKDLTQQLLTFSKGGDPIKTTATIIDVIKDSADFVISGANVKCAYEIPDHLWPVEIDKGQISQVIQNLIVNASQAMPDGGIIKVSCENFVKKKIDALPIADGNYIKLIISDTGSGVPLRLLSKIFDPYFTTKKEGNGLGLAVCYSIIDKHNGHISVESIEGEGTSFAIYLPTLEEVLPSQQVNHAPMLSGKGKILVMDDNEMVRNISQKMLSIMGYEVFLANDGSEAIESYQNAMDSGSPFGAVIMDLTIPGGMGGREAGQKLLVIDPDVKIIVSSGYSNDPIMACHLDYGFKAAVAKPFQINELSLTLQSVLTVEQSA